MNDVPTSSPTSSDESVKTNPCSPADGPLCPDWSLCFGSIREGIVRECSQPERRE